MTMYLKLLDYGFLYEGWKVSRLSTWIRNGREDVPFWDKISTIKIKLIEHTKDVLYTLYVFFYVITVSI